MADRQITKESQARTLRGWLLGLHATHIIDVGGRLGYFAELQRRGEPVSTQELASALGLDSWRTEVWCRAACAVGVLEHDGKGFLFAPFMDELLGGESAELALAHVMANLSRDFAAYPQAFRSGATTGFHEHDDDFFYQQSRISVLRAPEIIAAARKLPGVEARLVGGGKVLDIGSGSGTVLMQFAEAFPTCQVIGVEPLPYFIGRSQRLIQEWGLGNRVRVESISAEHLSCDQEFDLITMVQVLHELPDHAKTDILRRCRQSLRPDGVLLVVDRCVPEANADAGDRRFTMSILEQWFEVTWGNIVNTRSEILQMLHDTGLTVTLENTEMIPTYWTFAAQRTT